MKAGLMKGMLLKWKQDCRNEFCWSGSDEKHGEMHFLL